MKPPPPAGSKSPEMSVSELAQYLTSASGNPVTEEMVREDIAAGAPTNPGGTINLLHYAAWLVKKISNAT